MKRWNGCTSEKVWVTQLNCSPTLSRSRLLLRSARIKTLTTIWTRSSSRWQRAKPKSKQIKGVGTYSPSLPWTKFKILSHKVEKLAQTLFKVQSDQLSAEPCQLWAKLQTESSSNNIAKKIKTSNKHNCLILRRNHPVVSIRCTPAATLKRSLWSSRRRLADFAKQWSFEVWSWVININNRNAQ